MAIRAQLLKRRPEGAILIEVTIVAVIIAIVTVACLNLFNIARDIYLDSKGTYIAVNVLDSIMTYDETYCETDNYYFYPFSATIGTFSTFATPSNFTNLNKIVPPQTGELYSPLVADLNQLKNWKIEHRIDFHNGPSTTINIPPHAVGASSVSGIAYKEMFLILRITWDGVRRDSTGNPIRKKEEIFSIFTKRRSDLFN